MDDLRQPILPGKGASDYERYLRTDELLALQKLPEEFLHKDELTFQVVHQASELLLKGAVWELERARAQELYRRHVEFFGLHDVAKRLLDFDERIHLFRFHHLLLEFYFLLFLEANGRRLLQGEPFSFQSGSFSGPSFGVLLGSVRNLLAKYCQAGQRQLFQFPDGWLSCIARLRQNAGEFSWSLSCWAVWSAPLSDETTGRLSRKPVRRNRTDRGVSHTS